MGPGDASSCRERISPGPHRVPGRPGLRPRASSGSMGFPWSDRSTTVREEDPGASPRLEDVRQRFVRAFQRAVRCGGSRRAQEAAAAAAPAGAPGKIAAAREERSRARVEGALAGLRSELLEMHFQNRQLARTLLDLNMKMQQLKKEYGVEIASETQSPEDDDMNSE
ncbi:alanine and arginine-rich domain-containing protein [Tupaia chinensis]|uniref:alanine and arginine-rich domain-containing protein n=1 Tax=Tupaia chinensis TaxID=246437 RepID=UPI0003C8C8EF|nr:alanine and arginine-rich domain-containing protein [Tupaia chinensis]